ncbi:MAG: hypothetical protein HEP71_05380 [Roseivirga sp.]|nr:hypothetical protein [Roseivirga sp.]
MKKPKLIIAIPLLTMLFIAYGCSDRISSPNNETPSDSEAETSTTVHTRTLMSRVNDRESLQPVKDVLVMSFPSRSKGITNAEGTCSFERPETDTTVVFTKKGYGEVHAPLRPYDEMVGAVFDKQ